MSADKPKAIRVLFVEDAFDQAMLVKTFLPATAGYEIVHAQDGDLGSKLVIEREWDLLITDLNLPGLDGFHLCRVAKSARPDLPILAITGHTGAQYQEEAYRAGATDLMTKPLDRTDFVAKVEELSGTRSTPGKKVAIAVGGLVGDVEMGCAGALVKHKLGGGEVVIVPLCRDELDPSGAGLSGARKAAVLLGFRLQLDEMALDDTQRRGELLERLIRDVRPVAAYIPAMDDHHPSRREAFRLGKAALGQVPTLLGYQTATTGMDFKPHRFVDVSEYMVDKMEALTAYQEAGAHRLDLMPRLAQAYARYWGRLERFTEVEPFEVLRG